MNFIIKKAALVMLMLAMTLAYVNEVQAHKVTAVSVVSRFNTKAYKYRIELAMDIYPSEDAAMNDKVSPQQAADFFSNEALQLFFGDKPEKPESKTELIKDPDADPTIEEEKVKVMVTLFGVIPKDAEFFSLRVSPETTAAVVMVTFKNGKPGRRAEVLYPGEFSSPLSLATVVKADPFAGVVAKGAEKEDKGLMGGALDGDDIMGNLEEIQGSRKGLGSTDREGMGMWDKIKARMWGKGKKVAHADTDQDLHSLKQYAFIGARSFFSGRYEGVILVLCLFFFSKKSILIVRQVVVFTVAYSLALLLAVFGIKSLSGMLGVSEMLLMWGIPLGIMVLAIENLFTDELKWWRQALIAVTGFLLGTVFSVTLSMSGMSAESVAVAFGGFYLGLGLAQLAVLLLCSLLVGAFWSRPWYRRAVVVPVSVICAGFAIYWMVAGTFL
ncbi:MAG: HupE/UreJ family protein [Verrucomicrobiales bacterium]|nr:HupE/UreJ family protein [Verrucomicrobiales bacterium]